MAKAQSEPSVNSYLQKPHDSANGLTVRKCEATVSQADLVKDHAVLVRRIAYRMKKRLPPHVDVDDLIQAGMIALIECAPRHESTKSKFTTYAGICIKGAMIDELRRSDWLPRSVHKKIREGEVCRAKIEQDKAGHATDSEIAAMLSMSLDEYHEAVNDRGNGVLSSLDWESEDGATLMPTSDELSPEDQAIHNESIVALMESIDDLPDNERVLMEMYYNQDKILREIAEHFGYSESRACQVRQKVISCLREKHHGH